MLQMVTEMNAPHYESTSQQYEQDSFVHLLLMQDDISCPLYYMFAAHAPVYAQVSDFCSTFRSTQSKLE